MWIPAGGSCIVTNMSIAFDRRRFLELAGATLTMPALAGAATKRPEVRGVWMHPERSFSADAGEGRKQIRLMVEQFARANFNLVLPWIKSDYLVALESASYAEAHPTARWDALGVLIEECGKQGLRVDLWYGFTDYRDAKSPDYDPRVGGDPGWMALRLDEVVPDAKTGKVVERRLSNICPQHWQARVWQQKLLLKTAARYPLLRGIHIEEPGYGEPGYCVCDLCQETFARLNGRKLTESIETQEAEDFRTLGCSAFMGEMRMALEKQYPKIVFSTNGGHDWRHDRIEGRDWARWAYAGWLKYYASQVYVTDTEMFRKQLAVTLKDIGPYTDVYGGIAFDWSTGKNSLGEVVKQVYAARELGAPGVMLFHGAAFTPELYSALKSGPFQKASPLG
jgi:uncharacterized lipoprotein YddW (UPF0748 family)